MCLFPAPIAARSATVWRLWLITLGLVAGCGNAPPDAAPGQRQAIIEGTLSPPAQNAVVAIVDEQRRWVTGTLVAPTLVLTVRHGFMNRTDEDATDIIGCNEALVGAPAGQGIDPADFSVLVGNAFGLDVAAHGKRIFAGDSLDLCQSDVALLELDTPLDIEPLPLRLDAPTQELEHGTLIGWGMTEEGLAAPKAALTLHGSRRQIAQEVEAVGPDDLHLDDGGVIQVLKSWFATGQGACFGDSGGPFISNETGAVVGVFSSLELGEPENHPGFVVEDCYGGHGVYRRLAAPEYTWIEPAFRAAGEAPWYEGRSRPAPIGAACEVDQECMSALCLHAASTGFCSADCTQAACPADMQCVAGPSGANNGSDAVCVPSLIDTHDSTSNGCNFGHVNPDRNQGILVVLAWLCLGCARNWVSQKRGRG